MGELTRKIGISTGAFYLLYSSKEDLFCETLERVQDRLKSGLQDIVGNDRSKAGFIKSIKWLFGSIIILHFYMILTILISYLF
ncbi:TetR/AcrR family transcriptional regulator [Clostridium botulinum]|nr:TetR/AcrR family transcriptional regulator [Clostridium botulinum]